MPTGRRGETLLKTEKKYKSYKKISLSLSQLSMVENRIPLEFLTHLQKATPRGLYRHLG